LGGQTFRPAGLKVWRSCSTDKILQCLDVSDTRPLGPKQFTTRQKTSWPSVLHWKSGRWTHIFTRNLILSMCI